MRLQSKLKSTELDMTPMIDMVFLLIVFFTLVLNFAAADQNERIKLPVSEVAQPPELPPTEPIILHVLTDGNVIYNGEKKSLQKLKNSIDAHLRFLEYFNTPLDKVTVIIRGDVQCETGQILDVLELCTGFGLTRIVLRAKQQD